MTWLVGISGKAYESLGSENVAWAIVAAGVLLRGAQYLAHGALFVDEAALALNIVNRSMAGLLQPLDYDQGAPIGFLLVERLAVLAFGNNEFSLRLFPFLAGVGSMFLFREVARRILSPKIAAIALAFFAASDYLIYYSAQVKQYSTDVALTLLVLVMALRFIAGESTVRRVLAIGLAGVLAVWLSHPAIFVLSGAGVTLALRAAMRKEWRRFWHVSIAGSLWLISFGASYLVSLRGLSGNANLQEYWEREGGFIPLHPLSRSTAKWLGSALLQFFVEPMPMEYPIVASVLLLSGCAFLCFKKRTDFFLLLLPMVFAVFASSQHRYPLASRLLLFAVPLAVVLIAAGAELFTEIKGRYLGVVGYALAVLLLFNPVVSASYSLVHPRVRENIRPIMEYVRDHRQAGDILYVYHHQKEAFEYYAPKYGIGHEDYVIGLDPRYHAEESAAQINDLHGRGGRVWTLFSHVRGNRQHNEEAIFLAQFDKVGTRLDSFGQHRATVYLYDMSRGQGTGPLIPDPDP